jgi:hypothetical protein
MALVRHKGDTTAPRRRDFQADLSNVCFQILFLGNFET